MGTSIAEISLLFLGQTVAMTYIFSRQNIIFTVYFSIVFFFLIFINSINSPLLINTKVFTASFDYCYFCRCFFVEKYDWLLCVLNLTCHRLHALALTQPKRGMQSMNECCCGPAEAGGRMTTYHSQCRL